MAVNLSPPDPKSLLPVEGVMLGVAEAGIRKADRKDLLVIRLDDGARVAAVVTRNRALMVNTGYANDGTGKAGLSAARQTCAELARAIGCTSAQVLPLSTGVIMEPLPVEKLAAGLPVCLKDLSADNWLAAARAIMT